MPGKLFAICRKLKALSLAVLMLSIANVSASAQDSVTILDGRHYSNVFGEIRNYRIFLPRNYSNGPDKRYPVIYFFHGWSQRYFGTSTPYSEYDKGDENGGDNIEKFVLDHDVIVVKVDGYNRSSDEKYYVRPWNIGPVETYRQFPLYFPELVDHIDTHYRTVADRGHRGISGLSMGGFMTFWIGAKYPHLLSAAGNFCGSPEFVVGPKDFPVEYRHLDMYDNYAGMKLRLNYGNKDFIRGYHEDMNRIWPQIIDNYEYEVYDAEHTTCGMGEMFSFILKTFETPPVRPSRWDHIDVYPDFSVWDYNVMTDRTSPGFTVLENVDARGFRCAVREFLPDGPLLSSVKVTVRTPALYEKNRLYTVNDVDTRTSTATQRTVRSDNQGRLTIELTGSTHEVGINKAGDKPNLSLAGIELEGARWVTQGKDVSIGVKVINKGLSPSGNVRATLSVTRPGSTVTVGDAGIGVVAVNETKAAVSPLTFRVADEKIEIVKLKLTLRDDKKNEWVEFFELPVEREASDINDFEIADGKVFTVVNAGVDSETLLLGQGNGDGVPNPGESIVILVRDQDKLWRTDVVTRDPYINPFGINVRKSDYWGAFDHVGGSAKYDVPLIASGCPQNHPIEFLVSYWVPEYPLHHVKRGIVRLEVKGEDVTPPAIDRVQVTGDNVLQIKLCDGSKITNVKATLTAENDLKKSFQIRLTDDGANGDRAKADLVFSQKVPSQFFGIFRAIIEAEDSFGNKVVLEPQEHYVLH